MWISKCTIRMRHSPEPSWLTQSSYFWSTNKSRLALTRQFSAQGQSTNREEWGRNSRQSLKQNLKRKTQKWLREEVKLITSWRRQDTNTARSLLEQWMLSSESNDLEKARFVTRIYHKWISNTSFNAHGDYSLFVENLNRILNVWKQARATNKGEHQEALGAFQATLQKAQSVNNTSLLPRDKTFSSLFNLMAMSTSSETLDDARSMLSERLRLLKLPPPDVQFWNSFLNVLAKSSSTDPTLVDEAEEILEALQDQADERTIASVLEAWVHSNRPEAGERTQYHLDQLTRDTIYNIVCFNFTIEAWVVTGHPHKAEECLMQILQLYRQHPSKITPDSKLFLAAIRGWSSVGDVERAEQLIDLMHTIQEETGQGAVLCTSQVFVAILQAWAKRGNGGPYVDKLLHASIDRILQGDTMGGDWLSPHAFTVAIKAWAHTSDPDAPRKAEALMERMDGLCKAGFDKLAPNPFHYSAVISTWGSSNRSDATDSILRILSRCNATVGPNKVVYNAAISALARHGSAIEAHHVLSEMKSFEGFVDKVTPDCDSYISVIRAYHKGCPNDAPSRSDELLREVEELSDTENENEASQPSEALYLSTILAQSVNSVEAAEDVFWKMVRRYQENNRRVAPTLRICNNILKLWLHSDDGRAAEKAESLLRWLKDDGCGGVLHPDELSYLHVIDTWSRSERRSAASRIEALLGMMSSDPNTKVNSAILDHVHEATKRCGVSIQKKNHLEEMCGHLL